MKRVGSCKDSHDFMLSMEMEYDEWLGLSSYNVTMDEPFGSVHHHEKEDLFDGSLRNLYLMDYVQYQIKEHLKMSFAEWLTQPPPIIENQLLQIPRILKQISEAEERAKKAAADANRKKAQGET